MIATMLAAAALAPASFVALEDVEPSIRQDMRYATAYNFVGRRIDGYREPLCIVTRDTARALKRVQAAAVEAGHSLKVYDCYRPQRAVDHFVRWAGNGSLKMKREFYPHEAKSTLFERGYIARRSGHSRGSTVDLTLVGTSRRPWCAGERRTRPDDSLPMGTGYDCFDPRSHTLRSKGRARENRLLLRRLMEDAGFEPYDKEWWHFTLGDERYPDRFFDFPASRSALR